MYYEVGSQLEQNNDFFNKCFYSKVFIKKVFKKVLSTVFHAQLLTGQLLW